LVQPIVLLVYPFCNTESQIAEKKYQIEPFYNKFLNIEHAYQHDPIGDKEIHQKENEIQPALVYLL
jgi:hypothetical protein